MAKKGCLGCLGVIVLVIVLGIIGSIVGGNHSKDGANSSSSTSTAVQKKERAVTYEKFMSLQMGATYDDVKSLIGKDGELQHENDVAGQKTKAYVWKDGDANMSCIFQGGKMTSKSMASLRNLVEPNGKDVSMAQFEKIEAGMSYDDVKGILGRDGLLMSEVSLMGHDSKIFVWMNKAGANMNISFSNGNVDSKTQTGLK